MNYELSVAERGVFLPTGQELLEATPTLSLDWQYEAYRIGAARAPILYSAKTMTENWCGPTDDQDGLIGPDDFLIRDRDDAYALYMRAGDNTLMRVTEAFNPKLHTIDVSAVWISARQRLSAYEGKKLVGTGYMVSFRNDGPMTPIAKELRMIDSAYCLAWETDPEQVRNLMDTLHESKPVGTEESDDIEEFETLIKQATAKDRASAH